MARLRLIFMGTPDIAVPALAALIDAGHEIARGVTGFGDHRFTTSRSQRV
jgi:methionyl-tRNA formyltransferase